MGEQDVLQDAPGQAIVLDNGSAWLKAGFAGDSQPRALFPTVVGRQKHQSIEDAFWGRADDFVGDDAWPWTGGGLALKCPLERRLVTNWDDMDKIWHHTFYNKLRVAPEEHSILLTGAFCEPNRKRNADRERTTEIMFETFNVPQLYMKNQAVLSLLASGRTTGCVVDCGEGGSQVASIQDGYCMSHTITRLEVGGQDLTDYLVRILTERGHYFSTSFGRKVVRQMKEELAYVAFDFDQEQRAVDGPNMHHMEKSYELPDAKVVVIGSERFRCQEPLFQPKLLGRDVAGIHECTVRAINKCDMDIGLRRELFSNIVLAGGSTEAPGFAARMTREIAAVARSNVKVEAPPDRKISAWLGGSQFASTGAVDWITKAEYDESGPSIVHRKCWD